MPFKIACSVPTIPYAESESEAFDSGWERFVAHVKHRSRYYFLADPAAHPAQDEPYREKLSVSEVPSYLGEAIRSVGLIRELHVDTRFVRARLSRRGDTYSCASALGTVPTEYANSANRMSPAGIALFYGSADTATAIAEVYDRANDPMKGALASVGIFRPSRAVNMIDLSGAIILPSLFDEAARALREKVRLLNDFASAIAQPIMKDGNEHIEYTPTQIVTEYFRHVFPGDHSVTVDGIMYISSRRPVHMNYVLFVDNDHCIDGYDVPSDEGLWLHLPENSSSVWGPDLPAVLEARGVVVADGSQE